jgi:CDP-diacylglycerol--glycerol-3-phosphate 3-phosphatidyltransferase
MAQMAQKKTERTPYIVVNSITMYRLVSAPILLVLAWLGYHDLFKWLIMFSFFTDAIDGPISRKYKVTSVFGSRLDSVADDATVIVSTVALWFINPQFIEEHWKGIALVVGVLAIQITAALVAYKKVTSFHTYLAKAAAVVQALFFFMILFEIPGYVTAFYAAVGITIVQLIEEIIMIIILPTWKADIKGLYWALKERKSGKKKSQSSTSSQGRHRPAIR